jgi:hypothetical protein
MIEFISTSLQLQLIITAHTLNSWTTSVGRMPPEESLAAVWISDLSLLLLNRPEQSSRLLPATSQHGHSWHRSSLGPMAIYLFNVKTFVFSPFVVPPLIKRERLGFFYNWCFLTTPYCTRGHIKVGDIPYIFYIIHETQTGTKFYYIQGHLSMQDSAAAHASTVFKPKKRQLDTWTVVGLSAAKFKPLIFPVSGFSLSNCTYIWIFMI